MKPVDKVFVNYIPVADLTYLVSDIYENMKRDVIKVDGILYAPPNFLRKKVKIHYQSNPKCISLFLGSFLFLTQVV